MTADTTPGSSETDRHRQTDRHRDRRAGGTCAIHQPNLFPRLATLAKLYAADCWVVLDDVQFARRDYQHRARLAELDDSSRRRWLSIETHLPRGRAGVIRDSVATAPVQAARRISQLPTQLYGRSQHWPVLRRAFAPLPGMLLDGAGTAVLAEESALALLHLLGWRGRVVRSSGCAVRTERSARLADLTAAQGAEVYLCGTGGMRYLETAPFTPLGIDVQVFRAPRTDGVWTASREVSALWALARYGPEAVRDALRTAGAASTG